MTGFRVGIIGCGGIASSHWQGFGDTGRASVTTVYDLDDASAARRSEAWGATAAASAEELIAAVDIVVIATPGFARLEYIEAAVRAGRHVLCEKPLALDVPTAERITETVEGSDVVFMTSLNQRHVPELATLHEVAASGQLGGLVSAWVRWHAPVPSQRWRDIEASGHWRSSFDLSGGRINEFSSHAVDWLLWVLGEAETVYGRSLKVTEGFQLDDATYAVLECRSGTGLLDVSRHAGVKPEQSHGILGHHGSVALTDGEVWLTLMDQEPRRLAIGTTPSKHDHFLDCVETGEQPRTGVRAGLNTLRACTTFNASASSGAVESVLSRDG